MIRMITATANSKTILRIDFEEWGGAKSYAEYDDFKLGSVKDNYALESLGTYSGTAGQSC